LDRSGGGLLLFWRIPDAVEGFIGGLEVGAALRIATERKRAKRSFMGVRIDSFSVPINRANWFVKHPGD